MTPAEAFEALHSGPSAVMSYPDARRLVALELEMDFLLFRPDRLSPEQEARFWEAIEIIRSYEEMRHLIEADEPPSWSPMDDEVKALLAPQKREKRARKASSKKEREEATVAAQNSLWKRTSY